MTFADYKQGLESRFSQCVNDAKRERKWVGDIRAQIVKENLNCNQTRPIQADIS
jgi:hypothetical protein